MTLEKAQEKMAKKYASIGGTAAIPWASIIEMIMTLLGGCTAKRAKRFAKNHPEALQSMIEDKLAEDSVLAKKDIGLTAQAAVDVFNTASVADIEAIQGELS